MYFPRLEHGAIVMDFTCVASPVCIISKWSTLCTDADSV